MREVAPQTSAHIAGKTPKLFKTTDAWKQYPTLTPRQDNKVGRAEDTGAHIDLDQGSTDPTKDKINAVLIVVGETYKDVAEHIIRNQYNKDLVAINIAAKLYISLQKVTTPTLSRMCLQPPFTMS